MDIILHSAWVGVYYFRSISEQTCSPYSLGSARFMHFMHVINSIYGVRSYWTMGLYQRNTYFTWLPINSWLTNQRYRHIC